MTPVIFHLRIRCFGGWVALWLVRASSLVTVRLSSPAPVSPKTKATSHSSSNLRARPGWEMGEKRDVFGGKLRPYVASGRPRGRLGGGRRRLLPVTSITANPALLNPTTHHHTKVSQVSRNTCVTSIESITANPALLNTTTHHFNKVSLL